MTPGGSGIGYQVNDAEVLQFVKERYLGLDEDHNQRKK